MIPTTIYDHQIQLDPNDPGNAVLVPAIDGDNMRAILSVFRGETTLAEIPDQVFDTTAPTPPDVPESTSSTITSAPGETAPPTATTLPPVIADENIFGIVPDKNITC